MTKGQFVVVKYDISDAKKTSTREFVGRVEDVLHSRYTINFLRPYRGKDEVFCFPQIEDIDDVSLSSIVKILPTPIETRKGIFDFINRVLKKRNC